MKRKCTHPTTTSPMHTQRRRILLSSKHRIKWKIKIKPQYHSHRTEANDNKKLDRHVHKDKFMNIMGITRKVVTAWS